MSVVTIGIHYLSPTLYIMQIKLSLSISCNFYHLNLMMKVTPLAPWSSISFFKDEMLFRLCFPIIVSGYLRAGSRDVKCTMCQGNDRLLHCSGEEDHLNTLNFGWG